MQPKNPPEKVDLKKTLDSYRARKNQFRTLTVPPMQYLMVDGHGDPNTSAFSEAVESLYPLAYTLKFLSKNELGRDYVVPPLEGLWWADDYATFSAREKGSWDWTAMLLVPDWLGPAKFATAVERVAAKAAPPRLGDVRLASLDEGLCVQTLHVGSFDAEGLVLERMHDEYFPAHGLELAGKHHEIYLSDFRRSAPEKRRTILRQPARRAT